MSVLEKFGEEYVFQKTFDWLKFNKQMYVDFYLPNKNIAIEFQGEQHYKPVSFRNVGDDELKKEFETIQNRDKVKKRLCEENGISIKYISYKDENKINEIVSNILRWPNQ